jgi:cytochrome c biogenesis protein CcdA
MLGLLTAISPCPMATNIAALAYISRRIEDKKYAVTTSALYTMGRMVSYSVVGILIVIAGLEVHVISIFLQNVGGQFLGPFLIIVGLLMLVIDRLSFGGGSSRLTKIGERIVGWGMIGGFLLGVIFALAFCPYSAVLYFAVLIPLALKSTGGIMLPAVFAVGTGLPVLIFGTLLSLGIAGTSKWLNAVSQAGRIIRFIVSIVFIGVGIYYLVLWFTL